MTRHLDLKAQFNISFEDVQCCAQMRLGRSLEEHEIVAVENAICTELYEVQWKMLDNEIRRLRE